MRDFKIEHNSQLPEKLVSYLQNDEFCIFLFHGVITENPYKIRNYTGKHIKADIFKKCIQSLSENGNPISMDEVLFNCENHIKFPNRSYAITFDDGFENNLSIAGEILNQFKTPATIYVSTDFIEKNSMSWIDKIELAVEKVENGLIINNILDKNHFKLDSNETKIKFLNNIRHHVKNSRNINPEEFALSVCKKLRYSGDFSCKSQLDKKLSWEQLKSAHESDYFTIGGHTHTHQILTFLNNKDLAKELDTSINLLEKKSNINLIHYSYPEGLSHCFSDKIIYELKSRGIKCCPTAIFGFNDCFTSTFLLRRIMVG